MFVRSVTEPTVNQCSFRYFLRHPSQNTRQKVTTPLGHKGQTWTSGIKETYLSMNQNIPVPVLSVLFLTRNKWYTFSKGVHGRGGGGQRGVWWVLGSLDALKKCALGGIFRGSSVSYWVSEPFDPSLEKIDSWKNSCRHLSVCEFGI